MRDITRITVSEQCYKELVELAKQIMFANGPLAPKAKELIECYNLCEIKPN